jgi:hypothetical protein
MISKRKAIGRGPCGDARQRASPYGLPHDNFAAFSRSNLQLNSIKTALAVRCRMSHAVRNVNASIEIPGFDYSVEELLSDLERFFRAGL